LFIESSLTTGEDAAKEYGYNPDYLIYVTINLVFALISVSSTYFFDFREKVSRIH
jgi:hypothetical protein